MLLLLSPHRTVSNKSRCLLLVVIQAVCYRTKSKHRHTPHNKIGWLCLLYTLRLIYWNEKDPFRVLLTRALSRRCCFNNLCVSPGNLLIRLFFFSLRHCLYHHKSAACTESLQPFLSTFRLQATFTTGSIKMHDKDLISTDSSCGTQLNPFFY